MINNPRQRLLRILIFLKRTILDVLIINKSIAMLNIDINEIQIALIKRLFTTISPLRICPSIIRT